MVEDRPLGDKQDLPPAPAVPIRQSREDEEDIMAILEAHLDPLQEEKMRQKAMQFALVGAIERRNKEKVQRLIDDGVNVNAQIMFTKTPLTHAIEFQHGEIAIQFLENACDPVLTVDHFPYSQPIHLAAREDLPDVIQKLIDLGVDPNNYDADQMSPLTIASYYGKSGAVEVLIRNGANIDFVDSCYRTPLHRAIEAGAINVVKLLVMNKANINATDIKGWSPLHLAISLDYQEIVKLLLENNCQLDYFDINGNTPLSIACDFLNRSNVDLIRATQFSYDGRKRDFIQGRYLSLLQRPREERELLHTVVELINSGSNVDGAIVRPITTAACADHADSVYMLLNAGAWIPQDWEILSVEVEQGNRMAQIQDWIRNQYIVQFSLVWQCKRQIRKLLANTHKNIENAVGRLPLPPSLKAFLK